MDSQTQPHPQPTARPDASAGPGAAGSGTASHAPPGRRRGRPWSRLRKAVVAGALAVALTAGGGAAWAADRFLIPKVRVADVAAYEAAQAESSGSAASSAIATDEVSVLTEDSFTRGDTSVEVRRVVEGSGSGTVTYYVADVVLGDATELRSAFAADQFGENIVERTSEIAADHGAVFAVNGDYYGFRDTGIVIRNGVVYRDEPAREGLAFYDDGRVEIYDETATSADDLVAAGVWNTLSFGPALVEGGETVAGIDDVEIDTNFGNHSIQGEQPRTAVGVVDENHLVFVVVDGRSEGYSRGVTMSGLAEIMRGLGAETAYNLDGGGSSTMVFDDEVLNRPSNGGERGTSDILYVAG